MLNSDGRKVLNAAFGMPYTLRAELNKPDGKRQTLLLLFAITNPYSYMLRSLILNLMKRRVFYFPQNVTRIIEIFGIDCKLDLLTFTA